ncbi:MAG TPA: hypothetical protein DF712_15440 [Balneola sp.]|nr:hypothetical protein [Bacteroidota bacterium]HCT53844.1 hypothetical protein [Balneola sp.]|tara:strand:- start:3217 stop:4332 length:1116 start_codon:yes stop_codon:yes gene_type:complete
MDFKIYPFKRNKKYIIYVRYTDQRGKTRNLSTGISYPPSCSAKIKKEAMNQAHKKAVTMLVDEIQQATIPIEERLLLSNFLESKYFKHLEHNLAEKSYPIYANALSNFLRICGNKAIGEYKRSDIQEYKLHRLSEGRKKTTINIEMRSIKAGFGWAEKNDFLLKSPFRGQDFLFETRGKRPEFKRGQLERLFKATEGSKFGLALQLAYYTGMRIGEATHIKWRMIDLNQASITIPARITKSNKDRTIPLSKQALSILNIFRLELRKRMRNNPEWYKGKTIEDCFVLMKEDEPGQYKSRSIQDRLSNVKLELELPKELTFHSLRHSFATHILEKNGNIYAVSKILGHSSTEVTSRYYDHTTTMAYKDQVNLL